MENNIEALSEAFLNKGKNIVFTGAGISTESGIPDFRSKGGIWDKYKPVYFDEFMSSRDSRIEYWRQKSELYNDLAKAKPNAAHRALAFLFEKNLLDCIITQNIDGLHQETGIPDDCVIELHGSNRRVRCMTCSRIYSLEETHKRIEQGDPAPECECGGFLKPDTISFGQSMPVAELERAAALSKSCSLFLVIGSTLLVQPAALMPGYAKHSGAKLAIINLSDTPYDSACDILIRESAGKVMEDLTCLLEEKL